MDSDREEMLYQHTLRMVLWDEDVERIYKRLSVNGIRGRAADALYQRARRERITMIRSENAKRAGAGILLILLSSGISSGFILGLGGMPRIVIALCAAAFGFGCWKLVTGLAEIIAAPRKKGSLADED
jgi:hypothetical protein